MSHRAFGFGEILGLARPTMLQAAAQNFAAIAGLARLAAQEHAQSSNRDALADFGWDASSLIECRISVAANKGFFGCAFVEVRDGAIACQPVDDEVSTARRVQ